ncbi:MAG: hypothetical protein ACRCW2_13425 [Cellulosilyticaceae bacterium]
MQWFKKDWLYDTKVTMLLILAIATMVGIGCVLVGWIVPEVKEVAVQMFDKIYIICAAMLGMYPMFVLKGICPQLGSDKVYLPTMNLPYTKKQLLWEGLKPWGKLLVVYSLGGCALYMLLTWPHAHFETAVLITLAKPVAMVIFMAIIWLQIFAGVVVTLAKQLKGGVVIGGLVVINTVLILASLMIGYLGGEAFMSSNGFSALLVGNLLIWSIVSGGYAFMHIEEVYQ